MFLQGTNKLDVLFVFNSWPEKSFFTSAEQAELHKNAHKTTLEDQITQTQRPNCFPDIAALAQPK